MLCFGRYGYLAVEAAMATPVNVPEITIKHGAIIMKIRKALVTAAALFSFTLAFAAQAQDNILNLTDREIPKGVMKQIARGKKTEIPGAKSNGKNWGRDLSVVTLRGKTNHFGIDITQTPPKYIDYWATVPGVKV